MTKTLKDITESPKTDILFDERAKKFEAALKPLIEKWGVAPIAVLQSSETALRAQIVLTDLWQKESGNE